MPTNLNIEYSKSDIITFGFSYLKSKVFLCKIIPKMIK